MLTPLLTKPLFVCRDFEYEDGDRVQILLNDEVLLQNLYLKNQYFIMQIDLKPRPKIANHAVEILPSIPLVPRLQKDWES